MVKRLPMTGWFEPAMLADTAVRVLVSTLFGDFADRRVSLASASRIPAEPFDAALDYAGAAGDFWFDYVADTADGWDATHAVARLLAAPQLGIDGHDLPRGKVLVMGGDQVYPVASAQAYTERLLGPFDAAWRNGGQPLWDRRDAPHLFAIPGNHDWYDGLNGFFGLFCRRRADVTTELGIERDGRLIGGRRTFQTRSYFALRLPGNWWIWATDSQLKGYIDQPQIDYFQHCARHWMAPGSRLILCVGTPAWQYVRPEEAREGFSKFSYLERLAGMATGVDGSNMGHRLKLVLTGDSHHYAHYVEGEGDDARHYLTCGGGGAFLHPTHHLGDQRFDYDYPPPGQRRRRGIDSYARHFRLGATFPSAAQSRGLTRHNIAFAWKNKAFTLLMMAAAFVLAWLIDGNALDDHARPVAALLGGQGIGAAFTGLARLLLAGPLSVLMSGLTLGAFFYFADAPGWKGKLAMGAGHWVAQTLTMLLGFALVLGHWPVAAPDWLAPPAMGAVAGVMAATMFGLYLWFSLDVLKRHWNEAFSSLAIADFKSFLRLHIAPDGSLTVWPIGLETVPVDSPDGQPPPPLAPRAIEPGIVIR